MSLSLKTSTNSNEQLSARQGKLSDLVEKIEQQKIELATWESAKNDIQQYARDHLVQAYSALHRVLFSQFETLVNSLSKNEFSKVTLAQLDEKIQSLIQVLHQSKNLSTQQLNRLEKAALFYKQYEEVTIHKKSKNKVFNDDNAKLNIADNTLKKDECDFNNEWDKEKYSKVREEAKLKKKLEKFEQVSKMAEQSLKKVYLKITAIIHPDREQDEIKKVEKTRLLQLANEAYEKQDLFSLLKMQIQVEQNQNISKKALSEEQIKFYQLALEAQSQKLQSQIDDNIESLNGSKQTKNNKKKVKIQISDVYKNIDADTSILKQQVKAEKERLKYMAKERGLVMLLENELL